MVCEVISSIVSLMANDLQVLTGLMNRDEPAASEFPVGIIPVGTANAMANDLDRGRAVDALRWAMHARRNLESSSTR